jgi:catechol 2,3-dioxygenase-like lactoylglutathione lyase family enzyme
MIKGLRTVIYPAPDLEEAKRWYAKALGVVPYFDQPFYVGFTLGGFELGLVPDAVPSIDGQQALWGVDDIEAVLAHLLTLNATELEPVTEAGGGIRVAAVRDPFGNRFGLIHNPHFDSTKVD